MFESKILNKTLLFIPLMLAFSVYMIFIKTDDTFIQAMEGVNRTEIYPAIKLDGKNNPKMNIRFGKFYDCLKSYRRLIKRKFPKNYPDNEYYFKVFITDEDLLFINISSEEAFQVSLESRDDNGIYQPSSDSHAINCDMDLIEIVDKK
jgi:hypothetical protein